MQEETSLTVEIKNEKPILLVDFTNSFLSLSDEYERYIRLNEPAAAAQEVKLFIREIRPGSIIAELIAYAPLALIAMSNANTIIDFSMYMKGAFDYFLGKTNIKPNFKKKNLENFKSITEPIAKDTASQYNLLNNGILVVNINSQEANAAQNVIARDIQALKEPLTGLHEKVLMYFFQARGDPASEVGDRVKIESIYPGPIKVIFKDESMKAQLLYGTDNLFTHAYIVDVAVETIDERPMLYRVQKIHESIERVKLDGNILIPYLSDPKNTKNKLSPKTE